MPTPSAHGDPRSVVTPDAFDVSTGLLGLRLAPPWRRLAAVFVDLLFIGFLTFVTQSFALILWAVAGVLLIRAGFKRTPVRGNVFGRAMRLSVGCLGVVVSGMTVLAWVVFGIGGRGDSDGGEVRVTTGLEADAPPAAPGPAVTLPAEPEEAIESREADAILDEVSLYTTEEALEAYAELLRSGRDGDFDRARRDAFQARLALEVAADTLAALEDRVNELVDDSTNQRRRLDRTEAALEEATSGGILSWFRDLMDEIGFGFGWATLYMTVILPWWKGQTIGKRMLGIRVLRLDGEPISWWVAFERAGGYAAGFATGLLGFAQIYWDANRQAIHDRIVGTVVVLDGAEKVIDWESAL